MDERPFKRSELCSFSYFDPIRKRWIRARFKASIEHIRAQYAQYRIEGPPEIREGPLDPRVDPKGPHGSR